MFQKKPHIPLTIVFIRLAGSCQKLSLLRSSSMRSKGHPVTHLLFESRSRLENNSLFAKRFQCIFTFFRKIHRSFKTFRGFLYKFTTLHFFLFRFCISFSTQHKMPFFVPNIPFAFKFIGISTFLLDQMSKLRNKNTVHTKIL